MRKTTKSIAATPFKTPLNQILIPLLGILIAALLAYMIWDVASNSISRNEGFTSSSNNKLSTLNNKKKRGVNTKSNNKNPSPGQSKLSELKHGKYNPNEDLKNYGMDGGEKNSNEDSEDFEDISNGTEKESKLDKQLNKMGEELGRSTLTELARKGKRDNFKNVINEVDNINPGAFDLTSIGGTIRRYNENFNNRLNYAKSKNEGDNLEATMAQGKVIFDEFKKIFLFTDMFA